MKEKYANKTPVMRFIHRYTGFIVCGAILAVAIPLFLNEQNNQEFFSQWSCPKLQSYILTYNQELYKGNFPDHDNLSEEQHQKLHKVLAECNFEESILDHK